MNDPKDRPDVAGAPHPRERSRLIGHAEAEIAVLEALRARRPAHAWLIGGPEGIGKATLAFRIARFVLSELDPFAHASAASTLEVPADHPTARHIAAESHPDLFVLQRTVGTTGKLRSEIAVEDARRATAFLRATSGEGGWKVLIVDVADELNRSAANALLKIIEEPPGRSLVLALAHAPARLPPTILSRCRHLRLERLTPAQIIAVLEDMRGIEAGDSAIADAAALADGSVKRALMLLHESSMEFADLTRSVLEAPFDKWRAAAQKLFAKLGSKKGEVAYDIVFDAIFDWLSASAVRYGANGDPRAEFAARLWAEIDARKREAVAYNLDKRALLLTSLKEVVELAL